MSFFNDKRPTLASWPRRIYEWDELPTQYHAYLKDWREFGLPAENVTLIPRIHQYKKGAEYVVAWLDDKVMLLMSDDKPVQNKIIAQKDILLVEYDIQLLACTIRVMLHDNEQSIYSFSYNKVKEDQLLPVIHLLLGSAPEQPSLHAHPSLTMDKLLNESYAMYNTARLCYRFDSEIFDSYWIKNKKDEEYFIARMKKGIVLICKNFYGDQVKYLRFETLLKITLIESVESSGWHKKPYATLILKCLNEIEYIIPVSLKKWDEASQFMQGVNNIR